MLPRPGNDIEGILRGLGSGRKLRREEEVGELSVSLGSLMETLEQMTVRMSSSSQPPLPHGERLQSKTFSSSPLHSTV